MQKLRRILITNIVFINRFCEIQATIAQNILTYERLEKNSKTKEHKREVYLIRVIVSY